MAAKDEIYKIHAEGLTKFTYFLLGLAVSAIAFAIHSTKDDALVWAHLPMGVAVLLWSYSFLMGLRYLEGRQNALRANMDLVQMEDGTYPAGFPRINQQQAMEILRDVTRSVGDAAGLKFVRQQKALLAGAICYTAGHVWQMALR